MPDFWTHILGGELIQDRLDTEHWQTMLTNNQQLFNFGCQGPDFLFYNDFWPWIRDKRGPQVGSQLHQQNVQSFWLSSLDYLKKKHKQDQPGFPLLASYLSGMAAHYALDKTAHPFINARTDDFPAHKRLELNLDTYLIKEYKDQQVHKLSPSQAVDLGERLPAIVKQYYQQILVTVHSLEKEVDFLDDSYQDFKQLFNYFYSPRRLKVPGFKLLNLISPMDLSLFIYPQQPDYSLLADGEFAQFKELLETAVATGVQLIETIIAYLNDELTRQQLTAKFPNTTFEGIDN